MVQWSPQQQAALDLGRRWLDGDYEPVSGWQVFKLRGFAGTGKTLLAKEFNEHVGGGAISGAYTGKAASVLRRRGLYNASTCHSLIYQPVGNDGEAKFRELRAELKRLEARDDLDRGGLMRMEALRRQMRSIEDDARQPKFVLKLESPLEGAPLLILDEVSQIDEVMGKDLESFGCRILCLGDPGQLPPIRGTGYYNEGPADVTLTEIHRQAADNPVLRLATLAREGKNIPYGEWMTGSGCARVVSKVSKEQALAADMVLTGTNKRRQAINRRHRELEGHTSPMPETGERICCLANNHEIGIQNGTLWTVKQADPQWSPGDDTVYLNIEPEEGGAPLGIPCEASLFLDDTDKVAWPRSEQFTWGSCLTVHKAQGSEWSKVVGFLDWPSNRSYREWCYTLITRASEELTLVM